METAKTQTSEVWIKFYPRENDEEKFLKTTINKSNTTICIQARTYVIDDSATGALSYVLKDEKDNTILPPQKSLKDITAEVRKNLTEVIKRLSV